MEVNPGGTATFKLEGLNGSNNEDNFKVKCSSGKLKMANLNDMTVENITEDTTCTATNTYTFTIESSTCPDPVNDNSSPCYIIAHAYGENKDIMKDWDGTATYNGKTYKNCIINNRTMNFGTKSSNCTSYGEFENPIALFWNEAGYWDKYHEGIVICSVKLTCDL